MKDILINSINNVRQLINNSILIMKDLDSYLSEKGYIPIFGNALGTETSKSINQSPDSYASFFPQYMFRSYISLDEKNNEKYSKVIAVNIQYYHADYEELEPVIVCGFFKFPFVVQDIKGEVDNWWLKFVAFENNDHEFSKIKDNDLNICTPFIDDDTVVKFWVQPLTSIIDQSSISNIVNRLISLDN
jgi:hypothetical protein